MNEPGFSATVEGLLDILTDLDEYDRSKVKLPNCPRCDEDELGVIHADLLLCYCCGWKIEGRIKSPTECPTCGGERIHERLRGYRCPRCD